MDYTWEWKTRLNDKGQERGILFNYLNNSQFSLFFVSTTKVSSKISRAGISLQYIKTVNFKYFDYDIILTRKLAVIEL